MRAALLVLIGVADQEQSGTLTGVLGPYWEPRSAPLAPALLPFGKEGAVARSGERTYLEATESVQT